jgi:DNA-binding NarL/FixJ family response regulator
MSANLKDDLVSNKRKTDFGNPFKALSNKELEVMAHIVKGKGITETATIMNLSNSTIATHKSRILTKLNLKTIHELIDLTKAYNLYS